MRVARSLAILGLLAVATRAAGAIPTEVRIPPDIEPLPVSDVLALTPEMREWAHAQVPRTLPPVERLDLLVQRLQAIDGAALQYDAWFTASAAEAFAARRFNCLSFSHLLIAMARELGLDAYYVQALYRERYDREGDLVLLAGHVTVGWGNGPRRWMVEFGNDAELERAQVRQLDDRRALALHYANLGATDLRRGDTPMALRALVTAVGVDPGASGAWVNLGVALRRRGDFKSAEAAYRRAIEVDPEMLPGYSNLYQLLRASGRAKEAKALVSDIMSLEHRDPWLLLSMGDECMEARDFAGAERLFKESRHAAPRESAPNAALAALALATGNQPRARKWLARAEQLDPREPRLVSIRAKLGLPQPPPLHTASGEVSLKGTVAPAPAPTPPPSPN